MFQKGSGARFAMIEPVRQKEPTADLIPTSKSYQDFPECAETAEADYLVTGNQPDFPERWKSASSGASAVHADLANRDGLRMGLGTDLARFALRWRAISEGPGLKRRLRRERPIANRPQVFNPL